MFFLNWKNGVNYNLVAQTPQYRMQSLQDLAEYPDSAAASRQQPEILARCGVASAAVTRWRSISHYNIRRVVDIYGAVQDRDLGAVSRDVERIVEANREVSAARHVH